MVVASSAGTFAKAPVGTGARHRAICAMRKPNASGNRVTESRGNVGLESVLRLSHAGSTEQQRGALSPRSSLHVVPAFASALDSDVLLELRSGRRRVNRRTTL
jgi:hypothetical protein